VPHPAASVTIILIALALIFLATQLANQITAKIMTAAHVEDSETAMQSGAPHKDHSPLAPFTVEVQSWEIQINQWSDAYQLPPRLIALVMQIESCGAPNVISSAGALGLFQVMPFHFSADEDPLNTQVNAARGLAYLARSYELAGEDIAKTLAGYNGGHDVIQRDRQLWPDETVRYVAWGTGIWDEIHQVGASKTLSGWLDAGGSQLCATAREQLPNLTSQKPSK
jgi:soluble lytic murein transglycosylase-like protein